MPRDFAQRALSQLATGRDFMPRRCAGGMREWDKIKFVTGALNAELAPDHLFQVFAIDELANRQSAHWNDQARSENLDLVVAPARTVSNFIRARNAIAATGSFARKTAANGREIDCRSYLGFVHSAELLEPLEQGPPGSMSERPLQNRFTWTGRLANQHDVAQNCAAGDGRRFHPRTAPASTQLRDVLRERELPARRRELFQNRRKIDKSKLSRTLRMMQVTIGK
jgi:hypothetical protein